MRETDLPQLVCVAVCTLVVLAAFSLGVDSATTPSVVASPDTAGSEAEHTATVTVGDYEVPVTVDCADGPTVTETATVTVDEGATSDE